MNNLVDNKIDKCKLYAQNLSRMIYKKDMSKSGADDET